MPLCAENSGEAARHGSCGSMGVLPGKKSQGGKNCPSSTFSSAPDLPLMVVSLGHESGFALEG